MSLIQMSVSGAVMILVTALLRAALLNRLPKRTFLVLWAAALIRLLVPYSFPSVFSVYSAVNRLPAVREGDFAPIVPAPGAAMPTPVPTSPGPSPAAPVVPVSPAPAAVSVNWWAVVWAVGAALCLIWFGLCYFRYMREFRTSLPVRNEFAMDWLNTHGLRRKIRIRQSAAISAPLTYGVFRPVILMPKETDWEDHTALGYILEHEFIHIRRLDSAWKLCLTAALCIHWFNPAVWLLYFLANRDIELSCDEAVIRRFGREARSGYAMTLIHMEERKGGALPTANGFSKNAIEERIRSIMKTKKRTFWVTLAAIVLVAATVILFATSPKAGKSDAGPDTTAASEQSELLGQLTLDLPGAITREPVSDTRDALVRNGQVIGGVVVMELDREAVESYDQLNDSRLWVYLTTDVVTKYPPEVYSGICSSGRYSDIEVDCDIISDTNADTFRHYIYIGNSACYDLWTQLSLINPWDEQIMAASLQSPDIPGSGAQAFSQERVTKISFDGSDFPLPDTHELPELLKAMEADLAAGTAIHDASRYSTWFHQDGLEIPRDSSAISLWLSTEDDIFSFSIYPECKNLMAWMEERNILKALNVTVVEKNWDFSFTPVEADTDHLTLKCTRTSGHACQMPMDSFTIVNQETGAKSRVSHHVAFYFGPDGTAEVKIDLTQCEFPLSAGTYQGKIHMRNPDSAEGMSYTVDFTIPQS